MKPWHSSPPASYWQRRSERVTSASASYSELGPVLSPNSDNYLVGLLEDRASGHAKTLSLCWFSGSAKLPWERGYKDAHSLFSVNVSRAPASLSANVSRKSDVIEPDHLAY